MFLLLFIPLKLKKKFLFVFSFSFSFHFHWTIGVAILSYMNISVNQRCFWFHSVCRRLCQKPKKMQHSKFCTKTVIILIIGIQIHCQSIETQNGFGTPPCTREVWKNASRTPINDIKCKPPMKKKLSARRLKFKSGNFCITIALHSPAFRTFRCNKLTLQLDACRFVGGVIIHPWNLTIDFLVSFRFHISWLKTRCS